MTKKDQGIHSYQIMMVTFLLIVYSRVDVMINFSCYPHDSLHPPTAPYRGGTAFVSGIPPTAADDI